jgi:deazaflavin-dependent oxidoreductase (nitroreductase family)
MSPDLEEALQRLDLIYLQHEGRTTGRQYTTELTFAYDDGCVYFLAHHSDSRQPDWLRNILVAGEARFYAGTRLLAGHPELLEEDWIPRIQEMFRRRYGGDIVRRWYEGTPRIPMRLSGLHEPDRLGAVSGG